ncbi:RidA family protein [Thauera sp. JM12B12]|uniref:RidA family protein n=1 Tax=Thauera sp. JM12B12 TaxID=3142262 RepID=UPI0031F40FF1
MSKIVRHNGVIYLCGQTSSGKSLDDVSGQMREVLARIDALLEQVGSDRSKLLATTIHLKNMGDFQAMNDVWEAWIPEGCAPARTTVEARLASDDLLVELTVIAAC